MKKYLLLISCFCGNAFFAASLSAQIPGSWEKHIVCTKCSYFYPSHYPPGLLDFADPDHGMLIGDDYSYKDSNGSIIVTSTVYVTSDGGATWKKHVDSELGSLENLFSLNYLTPDFAAGFKGGDIMFTRDQGLHWNTNSDISHDYTLRFVCGKVFSPSTIYKFIAHSSNSITRPAYIERSTDTGQTFQLISDTLASGNLSFEEAYMQDSLNIWAIVFEPHSFTRSILHTTDGGLHWKRFYPVDTTMGKGLNNPYGEGIILGSDSKETIYFVHFGTGDSLRQISKFDILYTTDAGSTWHIDSSHHGRLPFVTSAEGSKLWGFIGTGSIYSRFHCDTLAYSPNNGKNWYYDGQVIRGDSVYSMVWKDSTHGYIISYVDSTIWFSKYIPPPSSVNATSPAGKIGIFIYATPTITTDFLHLLALRSFSGTVSVYDILGRLQIQQPLNVSDGEKKDFSLSGLSYGVYIVVFKTGSYTNMVRVIKE